MTIASKFMKIREACNTLNTKAGIRADGKDIIKSKEDAREFLAHLESILVRSSILLDDKVL